MEQYRPYGRNQGMQNRSMCCDNRGNAYCEANNRRSQMSKQTQASCGCECGNQGHMHDTCDCDYPTLLKTDNSYKEEPCCKTMPVGMAYVPLQAWEKLYDPDNALKQGTAFPALNLIFCGIRGKCNA